MKYSLPPSWELFSFQHEEIEKEVDGRNGSYSGLTAEALYTSDEDLLKIFHSEFISGTFADLGCGIGRPTLLYAALFPERASVGIEFTNSRLNTANTLKKKLNLSNASFIHADLLEVQLPSADTYFLYFPTGPVLDRILFELYHSQREFKLVAIESHGDLYSRLDLENWIDLIEQIPLTSARHSDHARIYERNMKTRMETLIPFTLSYREHLLVIKEYNEDWIGETFGMEWTEGDRFELKTPPRTIHWNDVKKMMVPAELSDPVKTLVQIRRLGEVSIETSDKILTGFIRKIIISPRIRVEISTGEKVEWKDILTIRQGPALCYASSRP